MTVSFAEAVEMLSEDWGMPKDEVAAHLRGFIKGLPRERTAEHWHLKIWGEEPSASPRYYELPKARRIERR